MQDRASLMERMFELGRVLNTANGEDPPPVMVEPNGMRTIHETATSIDVMAVMLATQYINKIVENARNNPRPFSVQVHDLMFRGAINEATKDTILGYCLDAGWNEDQTMITRHDVGFLVHLFGPSDVELIEMDEASFIIALEYNSGDPQRNALCSSLQDVQSKYY